MTSGRRILTGLLIAVAGAVIFVERIGGTAVLLSFVQHWWPLTLVAVGVLNLFRSVERRWIYVGPVLAISVGAILLSYTLGFISGFVYTRAWPIILFAAGCLLALSGSSWRPEDLDRRSDLRRTVWLHAERVTSRARPFWRAHISVLLGAFTLDLREALFYEAGVHVNVNAVFGKVEIVIPDNVTWNVRRPIALPASGQRRDPAPSREAHLTVNVIEIFGDVRVRPSASSVASDEAGLDTH